MRLPIRTCLFLFACTVLLTGCQHPLVSERDLTPIYDIDGQARSLSLTTPQVQSAQLLPPGFDKWYDSRNDIVPSVTAGYVGTTYEESVTYTRDGQYTSNGRVRDQYRETTYRRTYRESTR